MSEQVLARVFEPFFSTKEKEGGTGLGLATVYNVVKRHGGEIEVSSEPGEGTTFRVLLPMAGTKSSGAKTLHHRVPSQKTDSTEDTGKFPAAGGARERCVLLVDDDEAILSSTGRLLRSWGYRVLAIGSGPEAIKLYEQRRTEIGCVVLDLVMPTLSGQETLRILRTIDADVQVILTSGLMDEDEIADLIPTVEGFVPKPHGPDVLKSLLERIFS